ncbi:MAG: hypothetical protein OEY14_11700, partial [Myxococcales bacterium]|nr:hypothetical protein [Myxococcales bacterium]
GPSQTRLTFLVDAPRGYFNRRVPEIASDIFAEELSPLPPTLQAEAERFALELGLRRGDPLPRVLEGLVGHFRSFEESERGLVDSGSIYLDIARSKRGICRHRAYAFVITALGLGVPARFVHNEVHAWVEVKLGEAGWMRVDLGGSPAGVRGHGMQGPIYRPREADPFPRPPAYRRAYERLGEASRSLGVAPGEEQTSHEPAGAPDPWEVDAIDPLEGPEASPEPGSIEGGSAAGRRALRIRLEPTVGDVLRGASLSLGGQITLATGEGVGGLRVEILLSAEHHQRLLGVTVSDARGHFDGSYAVPPGTPVGDYRLLVRTPGDTRHRPAIAR